MNRRSFFLSLLAGTGAACSLSLPVAEAPAATSPERILPRVLILNELSNFELRQAPDGLYAAFLDTPGKFPVGLRVIVTWEETVVFDGFILEERKQSYFSAYIARDYSVPAPGGFRA